jgi:hypothetical protein
MSKTQRFALFALAGVVVVACTITRFVLFAPIQITEASCERIVPGMRQDEVEALLGVPPGDYGTRHRGSILDLYGNCVLMREGRREQWGSDHGFVPAAGRPWTFVERLIGRALW